MALATPPVDYGAIRAALARAIVAATGLSSDQVLQMQAYGPGATRPEVPFAEFMLTGLGQPFGRDAKWAAVGDVPATYQGLRQLTAQFQFFGRTNDEAFGLAMGWVAGMYNPQVAELMFEVADLAVWRVDGPTNISQLAATAFEPRAAVNATFGVCSVTYANLAQVQQVPIAGRVGAAPVPTFDTP